MPFTAAETLAARGSARKPEAAGPNTPSMLYQQWLPKWQRCRDAFDGRDAVIDRGELYLPRISGDSDQLYAAYQMRAEWYGATSRTVNGLLGAVFRAEAQINVLPAIEDHVSDITLAGDPLETIAQQLFRELLLCGRVGVLIDVTTSPVGDGMSSTAIRPYWSVWPTEQIIRWEVANVNGETKLTRLVVMRTALERDPENEWAEKSEQEYRAYDLNPATGTYRVRVYRLKTERDEATGDTKDVLKLVSEVVPLRRGEPLDFIPFVFFSPAGLHADPDKQPLADLVDVNLSHWRTSADLEHGAHLTALPTPWVVGAEADKPLVLGQDVWILPGGGPGENSKVGMLEYTGTGLGALEKRMEAKENHMAALGARLLDAPKRAAEAAETQRLKMSGESSLLSTLVTSLDRGITQLLQWHTEWVAAIETDR